MEEILQKAFFQVAGAGHPLCDLFDLKHEAELSLLCDLSKLQESFRVRALARSQRLADILITEGGDLDLLALQEILGSWGHVLCPGGENDVIFMERQKALLSHLPELFKSIKRFQKPLCHALAERFVRETLQLPQKTLLTNAHIRRAVLSACLTLLRQNVGSCFATAPAIVIQEEQVERLVQDLYELLTTGKLRRVIAGTEFTVPLSPSWGWGDLRKKVDAGNIEYCPGFIIAMTKVGILDPNLSFEKQVAKAASFAAPFRGKGLTIEELLRAVLIGHFGVKIEEKEKEARSAFRSVCDHALLKAWEFTLASFSEAKMEFSRWNLYVSLGLQHDIPDGIGEVLYNYANEKLVESNKKVEEYQIEYENAFNQVKSIEGLLRHAATEEETRRLRAEYQGRYYHMQVSLDMRDKAYAAASNYSSLYSFMVKQYDEKFPEYFQEIYDAEMYEVEADVYDDSPAGFRLVYKHGRVDAAAWSFIYNGEQFIDALVDFFRMTEGLISAVYDWDEGRRAIQDMTTQVILHVRSKQFLDSAIKRRNKPWAYVSGGLLPHLLKIYYRREGEFSEEAKWVESEQELLIFFIDALKNLPFSVLEEGRKMLMHTPTHACILEPFWEIFEKGWREEQFTYTWVRDEVIAPRQSFYEKITLSLKQQEFLIQTFARSLPPLHAHLWQQEIPFLSDNSYLQDFRDKMRIESLLPFWDGFLYSMLPLTPAHKWKENVKKLISHPELGGVLDQLPAPQSPWLGKRDLLALAKARLLLAEGCPVLSYDAHKSIALRAQEEGLAPPPPVIFADTNWPGFFFAFLVNPGTLSLEFWRCDSTGAYGMPMSHWKPYLNGKERKTWGVFTRPYQYR